MNSKLIVPIARTSLAEDEIQSELEPLHSSWLVQDPKVREFEEKRSEFTGTLYDLKPSGISCSSAANDGRFHFLLFYGLTDHEHNYVIKKVKEYNI